MESARDPNVDPPDLPARCGKDHSPPVTLNQGCMYIFKKEGGGILDMKRLV